MLKKKTFVCLVLALALLAALFPAAAMAQTQYVYDFAALLSDAEEAELQALLEGMAEHYGMDFVALTTLDTQGKGTRLYCADFFEAQGFGQGVGADGMILCIDMENRQIMLVTHGSLIQILDDEREESLYDVMYPDVSGGFYADAFREGFRLAEEYVIDGVRHGQFTYDEATGAISGYYYAEDDAYFQAGLASGEIYYDEATGTYYYNKDYSPSLADRFRMAFSFGGVLFGLFVGALAGFGMFFFVSRRYKEKFREAAYDYAHNGEMVETANHDALVNKFVTTRVIPKQENRSSGGGGSSSGHGSRTFSSSSGGSFGGGGGRKF